MKLVMQSSWLGGWLTALGDQLLLVVVSKMSLVIQCRPNSQGPEKPL